MNTSDPLTNETISLEDLKRAVEAVGNRPFTDGSEFTTSRLCGWESRRANAWRMAFRWLEWHHGPEGEDDYRDGMALVEKLP